jgi:hypothetical protein
MVSVKLTSFNNGNNYPVNQTEPSLNKEKAVDSKTSGLSKTLFAGAMMGLVIGGSALYYATRNSSASENPPPVAPQLPKNICTIPEYSEMCEHNLGVPRNEMPQIVGDVLKHFLGNQSAAGFTVSRTLMKATDLTPIQSEMNTQKVLGMVAAFNKGVFDPCKEEILITVGDRLNGEPLNYVADGHHRYAACYILNRAMNVIAIDDQAQNVLNNAHLFPGVTRAEL